jgi:hypothetical protein
MSEKSEWEQGSFARNTAQAGYACRWNGLRFKGGSPHSSEAGWRRAVNDAGRFLDQWAALALGFGWQACDIFGPDGLSWFCDGELVRALGPDNAITASGRIFIRLEPLMPPCRPAKI